MTIAFVGTGVMGETLIAGAVRAGVDPASILAVDTREGRRKEVATAYGVRASASLGDVTEADMVVLAVKPQDIVGVLAEVAPVINPDAVVVSILAGVTTATLEEGLPAGMAVVRVMPNTPAQVDEGMAAVSAGTHATDEQLARVVDLMRTVGKAVVVPEKYQDAVTAISGSGPAYLFFVVEAMIDAGVMLGLPRDISTQLVTQTMYGSAKLLVESGEHPTVLRERVTSPGGTTAAALRELEVHRVKAAFMSAMEAARDRSERLAKPKK